MRFILLIPSFMLVACVSSDGPFTVLTCNEVASVEVDADTLMPSGDSAASVLAGLTMLSADVEIVAVANDGYGSFTDTLHWAFEAAGNARLATLDGTSHYGNACPVGDVLFVPAEVTLTSDLGLELTGTGTVFVVAATGDQRFDLGLRGAPVSPGYTTDGQCAGEPGPIKYLSYRHTVSPWMAADPGFENVEGGFSAAVDSEIGKCMRSVAAVRRL